MLSNKNLVTKNVKGCRLQAGIIYGSNPRTASSWCNQPTGPTSHFANYITVFINNGFWGVQNAKKSAFRNYTWLGC